MNMNSIRWQFDNKYLLAMLVSISLLVSVFWGGLSELIVRWDKQEEYSHGYMLPLISLYFIWQKKDLLKQIEFKPSWLGMVVVFLALLIFLIGEVSALFILIQYSFIAVLIGLAWSVMGWQALKIILIPLLLLVFAIPLPYFLEASLSANLQLLSSKLGVAFIRWCNIPVYLEGNLIDLGVYKLQVVEACSGLRYLFPLMSLGFICAYMFDTAWWKRAVVFVSTIPVTLLMNSFRIGMIGVLVDNWGISAAEGFLHDFEGWIIFMACMGVLFVEMLFLIKIGNDSRPLSEVFGLDVYVLPDTISTHKKREFSVPFLLTTVLLLFSFMFVLSVDKRTEIIPDRLSFNSFPMQLGEWSGHQQSMESNVVKYLGLSDYILTDYVRDGMHSVNFYAAYYKSQRKGVSPHSPRVCIPGGGWQIAEIERTHFSNGLPVNRILIKKGEQQQLVYYWFQQRGHHLANEYLMKWYLFKDAVLLNRTDGALVRLTTVIHPNEQAVDADKRLQAFADELIPTLPSYIPI